MTTNIERLQTFVGLMNGGRYDEAREYVSPKIVIREPQCVPYGGEHHGHEGFDHFRNVFGATWKRWVDGPMWWAEAEGMVAKYNTITATSRATGADYTTRLVELFRFEDGKIVEAVIFYQDTPEMLTAIGAV